MADSRRESIVAAIHTALQTITTANGYETNLGQHGFKWKGGPWQSGELPGYDLRDVADEINAANNGGSTVGLNREDHRLQVEIHLATSAAAEIDKQLRKMIADVYKKIGTNRTFGLSYVRTTWPRNDAMGLIQGEEGDAVGGATIKIEVLYHTAPFNPYA